MRPQKSENGLVSYSRQLYRSAAYADGATIALSLCFGVRSVRRRLGCIQRLGWGAVRVGLWRSRGSCIGGQAVPAELAAMWKEMAKIKGDEGTVGERLHNDLVVLQGLRQQLGHLRHQCSIRGKKWTIRGFARLILAGTVPQERVAHSVAARTIQMRRR